jgi:nucleoside-diphosphate-sugar epimerase
MKLVIAGATGFVATECVRQALNDPRFTSVIALARREVKAPADLGPKADASKLKSVIVQDYGSYSEDVKKQLAGTDACIWTVGVTPSKAKHYDWAEVTRVSRDNALDGFQVLIDTRGEQHAPTPLRFIYMSGAAAERDQTKSPLIMKDMVLMRVCS